METVVGSKYEMGTKINSPSNTHVYQVMDTETKKRLAAKLESIKGKNHKLLFEYKLYNTLKDCERVPNAYWYGLEGDYNVMIFDQEGASLEDLFHRCEKQFGLKTVLHIAREGLLMFEQMHSLGYVHRNISADHFLLAEEGNTVKAIGFGSSRRFKNPKSGLHAPMKENVKMSGNLRYASVNAHLGKEVSRRDDLESFGYLLVYFMKGTLPWQGIMAFSKQEKYLKVKEKKCNTSLEELCNDLPEAFYEYLNYCRNLEYEQDPDYAYLQNLFYSLAEKENFNDNDVYEWDVRDVRNVEVQRDLDQSEIFSSEMQAKKNDPNFDEFSQDYEVL